MDREKIGRQIWEYIDGTCNEADKQRIAALIATDAIWMQEYSELSALHTGILVAIEPEQPSMRFTQNVMDSIVRANMAPATKQYINKGVIKGIAAFFIIAILSMLTYTVAKIDWHTTTNQRSLPGFHFDVSTIFSSAASNIFIMVNIVLALVLADKLLRRGNTKHISG